MELSTGLGPLVEGVAVVRLVLAGVVRGEGAQHLGPVRVGGVAHHPQATMQLRTWSACALVAIASRTAAAGDPGWVAAPQSKNSRATWSIAATGPVAGGVLVQAPMAARTVSVARMVRTVRMSPSCRPRWANGRV